MNTDELEAKFQAISKSMAVIEFNMDGTVITANENFLATVDYSLEDIQGKHHSMFVDESERQSDQYREFWQALNDGQFQAREFKRIGRNGKEVWIQASYNPIFDKDGKPYKVVKFAIDITETKQNNLYYEGQIQSINRSQAVIEFNMDGTIINANDHFLRALGYSLDEVKGRHHRLFVDQDYARSEAYSQFWQRLNRGEYVSEKFKRIAKNGDPVWIQASYNPIMDSNGKPFRVVKYAVDVTEETTMVQEATQVLEAMSNKDLTLRMEGDYSDNQAVIKTNLNAALNAISDALSQTWEAAMQVNTASGEIAEGNTNLSQRTEEQSSSLEETASSMEELTSTVKMTAENAEQANQLALDASRRAEQGGEVINKTIAAMGEINTSSQKIADIIGVIDEIAFQTNLLALNAAVEAARAGEQGRGFAVVAAEVRSLAQRSASEAKAIRGLIKDSVEKIGEGSKLVDESGKSLHELVKSVTQVSDNLAEISAAAKEQSSGIEQINSAITQLDEMTQQNASLVEEAAAASKSLDEQAQNLQQLVSAFKLDKVDNSSVRVWAA